jgi:hypothetical protein
VVVNGFLLLLLERCCSVGVLCLIVRGVCVCGGCGWCGDECRVGRPVVAGLVVWSGVVVVFSVRMSGGMARGVPIAAWCERHNSYAK